MSESPQPACREILSLLNFFLSSNKSPRGQQPADDILHFETDYQTTRFQADGEKLDNETLCAAFICTFFEVNLKGAHVTQFGQLKQERRAREGGGGGT